MYVPGLQDHRYRQKQTAACKHLASPWAMTSQQWWVRGGEVDVICLLLEGPIPRLVNYYSKHEYYFMPQKLSEEIFHCTEVCQQFIHQVQMKVKTERDTVDSVMYVSILPHCVSVCRTENIPFETISLCVMLCCVGSPKQQLMWKRKDLSSLWFWKPRAKINSCLSCCSHNHVGAQHNLSCNMENMKYEMHCVFFVLFCFVLFFYADFFHITLRYCSHTVKAGDRTEWRASTQTYSRVNKINKHH